jgi:hypothetical protein
MGDVAASGGYYVSAPADCIIAHPTTITGSKIAARIPIMAKTTSNSKIVKPFLCIFHSSLSVIHNNSFEETIPGRNNEADPI